MPLFTNPNQFDDFNNLALPKSFLGSFPVLESTTMVAIPNQSISPGHARFIGGIILFSTQINTDGSTTAVVDTTTPLVVTSNFPSTVVASMDPSDNRKVLLTANPGAAIGGSAFNGTVTVNTNPPLPSGIFLTIPFTFTPAVDRRNILWDPAQGGTQGDVV